MSIFRRDESPTQPVVPPSSKRPAARPHPKASASSPESTHIAAGSKVVGRISGSADLVIDGVVEGEIELESRVVVGAEGRVEGKILAGSVQVGGKVLGNVKGLQRVEVLATGSLEGDVMSPRVVIAEGAFFKGKVEMTDKIARGAGTRAVEAPPGPEKIPPERLPPSGPSGSPQAPKGGPSPSETPPRGAPETPRPGDERASR